MQTGIREIGIAGGVSANSGLRNEMKKEAEKRKWNLFIPEFRYTTDNAAMIGITGYYKYLKVSFHHMIFLLWPDINYISYFFFVIS